MFYKRKTILIILAVIILAFLAQPVLGIQIYFPAWLKDKVMALLGEKELTALDYKDGTILLIKPIATGVGEGRYEAGDIVEIRDGGEMYKRFGNNNFLGDEERTRLLPVYYDGKLTEEEKERLLEVEMSNDEFRMTNNEETESKMVKRRKVGVDYTLFLSDKNILKVRRMEKLEKLPEIDLSHIIEKQTGLSYGQSRLANTPFVIPRFNRGIQELAVGLGRTISSWILQSSWRMTRERGWRMTKEEGWRMARGKDLGSVVKLPKYLEQIEKLQNGVKKIVKKLMPHARAQVSETVKTVDTGGYADYISLSAWEGANEEDITENGNPKIAVAKCRHATASSTADTTAVTIGTGWTTDSTHYIKVWTDPDEGYRHSGVWDESKYRLYVNTTAYGKAAIQIEEDYVRVIGLQVHEYESGDLTHPIQIENTSGTVIISHNIIKDTNGTWSDGIYCRSGTCKVYNNIIHIANGSDNSGIQGDGSGTTVYAYNNTVYGSRYGYQQTNSATFVSKNNIAYNAPANNYYWEGTFSGDYNLAGPGTDNEMPGSNSRDGVAVLFADSANDDFRLAYTDTGARDWGTDLSNDTYIAFSDDIDSQTRPYGIGASSTLWDIGADEYKYTNIYRSVGPSKTTALATSTDASITLSISGNTATFSSGQPNNIGVGDAIEYDHDNDSSVESIVFIHERTSPTVYTVKDASGHNTASTTIVADTDWGIFRAYSSLSAAEAGTENTGLNDTVQYFENWSAGKNLASSTERWNIACYGDAVDSIAVSISGWTTTADNYIKVYTPVHTNEVGESQRHNGKWDESKYHRDINNSYGLRILNDNVKVEGLQIMTNGDWDDRACIYARNRTNIEISHNIITMTGTGSGLTNAGIDACNLGAGSTGDIKVWNNIIYDTISSCIFVSCGSANGGIIIYNNTVVDSAAGIEIWNTDLAIVKNNLAVGNGSYDFGGDVYGNSSNNASGDSSSFTGSTNDKTNQTFKFVNESADDFHLAQGDIQANDQGIDLSVDANLAFSDDIDGEERRFSWDIGADQQKRSATKINVSRTDKHTDGLVGYWTFDGEHIAGNTAYDQSGQGNDGTLTPSGINGPTRVAGKVGQALEFDGDDYVDIPYINLGSSLTYSIWFKQAAAADAGLLSLMKSLIRITDGWIYYWPDTDAGSEAVAWTQNSDWNHFVVSQSGTTCSIYLNGNTLQDEGSCNAVNTTDLRNYIARGSAYYFNGLIDEVRIYNRALSAEEIRKLYNSGSAKYNVSINNNSLTSGLVGYWTFNGPDMAGNTAYDRSGEDNNGTLTPSGISGPTRVAGKVGQGLEFDGVDDYVDVAGNSSLQPSNITVSCWAYVDTFGNYEAMVSYNDLIDDNEGYALEVMANNGVRFYVDDGGGGSWDWAYSSDLTPLITDQWYHVVGTFDGTTLKIYVNGVKGIDDTASTITYTGVDKFRIGTYGNEVADFDGLIDEVRVYNRALSVDEIKRLYNLGK